MRRLTIPAHRWWFLVLALVTACSTGVPEGTEAGSGSSALPAETTTIEPSTTTSSTLPPSTSVVPSTTMPVAVRAPTLVLLDHTVAAPRLVFVDQAGSELLIVPLDRRTPQAGGVIDDHRGGIVVLNPAPPSPAESIVWWPAGADTWEVVAEPVPDADESLDWPLPSVIGDRKTPALLYAAQSYREYRDADTDLDVFEEHIAVRVCPLGGGPAVTVLSAERTEWWQTNSIVGSTPIDLSWGGDRLAVLWGPGTTRWLEFLDAEGAPVDLATNPLAQGSANGEPWAQQARVSLDGRYLVVAWQPPGRLVVYDLAEGGEVGSFDGPIDRIVFDGDRTIAAAVVGAENQIEGWMIATIEPDGLGVTTLSVATGVDYSLVGVLGAPPALPAGASLASSEPVTPCSGSSAEALADQAELPAAVTATRQQIGAAAASCDVFSLVGLAADLQWQDTTAACGDEPLFTVDEQDPVALWHQTEQDFDSFASWIDTLNTAPTLIDGVFWWRSDRHEIGISVDGAWVRYLWSAPLEPCETIWCTC